MRYALVMAAAAAVSFPLVSQRLRAQDEPAPAKEAAVDEAAGAEEQPAPAADEPKPDADAAAPAPDDDDAGDAAAPAADDADAAAPAPDDEAGAAAAEPKAGAADAGEGAKVVASAAGVEVTVADVDRFISTRTPQEQQQIRQTFEVNSAAKRQLVDHLLEMKTLAREAERLEIDEKPGVKQQLEDVREQILAGAMAAALGAEGEKGDKAYFEEHKDDFGKVQARHILIGTRNTDPNSKKKPLTDAQAKKKADEIRARLEKGEDFAALAKAESDDPGSKETGGTYTFGRGEMVPAFEQTAYGLKENEISHPVKTQFGYHVIQLQKRIPVTFEESRSRIGQERLKKKIRELMGGEPKYDDAFFGGGAATVPADAPAEKPAEKPAAKPARGKGGKGAK